MTEILPKCSICIHHYTNETFLRPCFHSFCFECICYWINITPDSAHCPICRRVIEALVYNIDEAKNEFDEYCLKDKKNESHQPPLHKKVVLSQTEQRQLQRRQVYKGLFAKHQYPKSLPQHADFTIIMPQHVPRARQFVEYELSALHGTQSIDSFIVNHIVQILLIPYSSGDSKMRMDDETVVEKISEWISDEYVVDILLKELIAYIKSGLSYKDFISSTEYKS